MIHMDTAFVLLTNSHQLHCFVDKEIWQLTVVCINFNQNIFIFNS